ncbi:PepSY-like domain-containing protein [Sphingobacterium corticis]|uniref:PepSY-like domain-containing protein n=1 Tax=Sphingobacterium corticis TaxID=1812823 RepID=A0ABW5NGF2_9SPHI
MKKFILNTLVLLTIAVATLSCDKEENVQAADLPGTASTFVSANFPNATIANVKREREGLNGREYEVTLNDGTQISFDKDGNWTEVDGPGTAAIPDGFVIQPIKDYIAKTYSGQKISSIEKDRNEFDVELTPSGIDLVFDLAGNFKRVD